MDDFFDGVLCGYFKALESTTLFLVYCRVHRVIGYPPLDQ